MLLMKPNCECCDRDLAADEGGAMICSFECTFCAACAQTRLKGVCLNCGGNLTARPSRCGESLARFPASIQRVVGDHDACKAA